MLLPAAWGESENDCDKFPNKKVSLLEISRGKALLRNGREEWAIQCLPQEDTVRKEKQSEKQKHGISVNPKRMAAFCESESILCSGDCSRVMALKIS
jgi:hypothetical protein